MSASPGSLPPGRRPACLAALREAAARYAAAAAELEETARSGGSIAVGRAAWYPGHRLGSPEAIAEYDAGLRARMTAQREAAEAA
jgi:hypothetical protein